MHLDEPEAQRSWNQYSQWKCLLHGELGRCEPEISARYRLVRQVHRDVHQMNCPPLKYRSLQSYDMEQITGVWHHMAVNELPKSAIKWHVINYRRLQTNNLMNYRKWSDAIIQSSKHPQIFNIKQPFDIKLLINRIYTHARLNKLLTNGD